MYVGLEEGKVKAITDMPTGNKIIHRHFETEFRRLEIHAVKTKQQPVPAQMEETHLVLL